MTTLANAPTAPRRLARFGAPIAVALALVASVTTATAAPAADNPYQRGPDPTVSSIEAPTGSFSVATSSVSRSAANGFGGGTIYYPTSTAQGTFGAVAISPGFTALESSISWLGRRLASQGFVVFTIDT
ncbi:poly(ethylene terephthalate) hydrolase family protein, partial [Actinokineospora pegani]